MSRTFPEAPLHAHVRRNGEGALAWLAFIVAAVLAMAAIAILAIRTTVDRVQPAASALQLAPGAATSPGPPPLPKPGVAPAGA